MKNKRYHYRAKNNLGESVSGIIEGGSAKKVSRLLSEQNLFVLDLYEQERFREWIKKDRSLVFGKVSFSRISQFAKDLSILLKAGITISQALDILQNQVSDQRFSKDIQWLGQRVRSGQTLAIAMAEKKSSFPDLFTFFVEVGEMGGELADMLVLSAAYYKRLQDNGQKMKEVLFYPLLLILVSIGVILFLLIIVLPQFIDLFAAIDQTLPGPTIFLLNSSRFLADYGILLLLGILGTGAIGLVFRTNPLFRKTSDRLIMKIPIYGKLKQWEFMMLLSKTMGILLNSGVDLMTMMTGLEAITPNYYFKEAVKGLAKAVSNGKTLSDAMAEIRVFQATFVHFTKVGEASGSMSKMMDLTADFYASQYDHGVAMLKVLIEPLLILGLGLVVLFILLAMMLPIFDLYLFYSSM